MCKGLVFRYTYTCKSIPGDISETRSLDLQHDLSCNSCPDCQQMWVELRRVVECCGIEDLFGYRIPKSGKLYKAELDDISEDGDGDGPFFKPVLLPLEGS